MVDHGTGHDQSWRVMAAVMIDYDRPWTTMTGHGRSWPVMVGHGRLAAVMTGHDRSWPGPWPTMAGSVTSHDRS